MQTERRGMGRTLAWPSERRSTSMAEKNWRGIFTSPVTPFKDDTELDLDSMRSELDFCVESGAHGTVHPVMASEFFVLTDEERLSMMPLVVKQVETAATGATRPLVSIGG